MKLTSARMGSLWQEHLSQKGLAQETIKGYGKLFEHLKNFLEARHGMAWDWRKISREDGLEYLQGLKDQGLSFGTRRLRFKAGCWVVKLLWKKKLVETDPWQGMQMRYQKNTVRVCLEEAQIQDFLESIEAVSYRGLRDRAMFELMYSSGLRPGEAARVKSSDLDLESRMLMIRQSKFGKDRVVPVTMTALRWLEELMSQRPQGYLFGGNLHKAPSSNTVAYRFHQRVVACGLWRKGLSAHSLRHSCARHLLAHGADIRYVQKLLGHESIETTVIYTHQQTQQVKKIYRRYHPREGLLYREVAGSYKEAVERLKSQLEPLMKRRLSRRSKTGLENQTKS